MSQIKISQLPEANTVSGNTLIAVVQDGTTERATVDVLTAQIFANAGDITANSITFSANAEVSGDESQILSVANSSGDGNGYTTLQLIPDSNLTANDQYLIIDPTVPTHIHIRGGGTQDASQAELYLGGETNYVRVQDGTGVRLQNQTRDNNSYFYIDPTFTSGSWYESAGTFFVEYTTSDAELVNVTFQFNDDSENILVVTYNGGANTAELTSAGSINNLGGGVYRVSVNEAPPTSPTAVTELEYVIWSTNTNSVQLQSNDFSVSVSDDIRITGNDIFSLRNTGPDSPIEIITNYDGASKTWEFGATGTLTAPGDIVVSGDITGTSGSSTLVLAAQPDSNTSIQLNNSVDSTISTVANLEIRTDASNTAQTWTFGTDGSLSSPGSITTTGNIAAANLIVTASLFGSSASPQPTISGFSTISATGNISVGNTLTISGVTILSTQASTGGPGETPTTLILSKSVQILDGSNYSLANGIEGQVMYFVPATSSGRASAVVVANARRWDYSNTGNAIVNQNLLWYPFDNIAAVVENNDTYTISMAIFTDGAWNLQGGSRD